MKSLLRLSLFGFVLLLGPTLLAQEPAASPSASPGAPLTAVVGRYEGMLAASPAKGTAFDKVYQHFFAGEGLDALAARWQARAADGKPGAESFLLLQGLLAERRARPDEARVFYGKFTAARPYDPRGWTALGELETAEGHFTPAADAFTRALAPDAKPPVPAANRPGLYRALARAQARDFLTAASLTTWRKLASEFPDDPGILQEVGEAFQEAASYDEARATFEKVRDLAKRNGDAFGRVNATLRTGQVEEARGHGPEAIRIYEGVVADSKAGSWLEREARSRIEGLYRAQEDLPGLAEYYKKSLKSNPKNVETGTRLAVVLGELGRRDEAVDVLRQAVAWAPGRQELAVELARRLGESGHPADAVAVLEKLTTTAPEERSYWQLLGDARWQQLELLPADAPTAAKAPLRAGALAAWNHLAPADGKPDPAATGQLAELLASHRFKDEALAQFARAAAQAPELPDTHERWAAFLASIGRKDEAHRVAAGIVAASPKNATPANYQCLAAALDRLDDPDGALDATAKGIALDGKSFDLLSLRWQLLTARKRWDEAIALYPALLAAAPNGYFVEQVQARHLAALQSAGKLTDTRAALTKRLGGQPPLDEGELALLVRASFQVSGEAAEPEAAKAKRALEEGRARFPKSVALARLEGEFAKRAHDPAGQVTALRRSIELQPASKTDSLAEIARVWRDAGEGDKALAAARELLAASPANAAAYRLLADLLLVVGHTDEALERLRDSVRLSDRPNEVRLRLARTLGEQGRADEARRTLDEAFEAAGDARERLALMDQLTAAYQADGKLEELVARFQRLQGADPEGWRYSLYLAAIYEGTNELPAARQELARALVLRPKDTGLLRQLVGLSTRENNPAETARYQALLTEAEPSDTNRFALVVALLDNNQPDEALAALRGHLAATLRVPGVWTSLLPLLARHDLTGKVGDLLADELGAGSADPRLRSTVALFQLAAGNSDRARELFWEVFDLCSPRVVVPAPVPAVASASPSLPDRNERLARLFYGGNGTAAQRFANTAQTRSTAQAMLSPAGLAGAFSSGSSLLSSLSTAPGSGVSTPAVPAPNPVDTARDDALIYLAALSVRDQTADQFLAELNGHLDRRESSRADRLIAYSLLNFTDSVIQELAAQVRAPEDGLDAFSLVRLFSLASENDPQTNRDTLLTPPLTPEQITAMLPLFDPLLERVAGGDPEIGQERDNFDFLRHNFLVGMRRPEEARALRRRVIDAVDERTSPDRLETALDLLLLGDFSGVDRARLREICRLLGKAKGRNTAYYPGQILGEGVGADKLPPAEFGGVMADLLTLWYPSDPVPPPTRFRGPRQGSPVLSEEYLPPCHFLKEATVDNVSALGREFLNQENNARLLATCAELDRQAEGMPPARRVYPRLFTIYLFVSGNLPGEALTRAQRLLVDAPEDADLRLLNAVLLGRLERHAEAVAILCGLDSKETTETPVNVQILLSQEAAAAEDSDAARMVAERVLSMRLTNDEKDTLLSNLRGMELEEEARRLEQAIAKTVGTRAKPRAGSILDSQTTVSLQELVDKKDAEGVLALARSIFAALPPPPANTQGGNVAGYVAAAAVNALTEVDKRGEFAAELEKALAKAPDSLALNYQQATLLGSGAENPSVPVSVAWQVGTSAMPSGNRSALWLKLSREKEEVVGSTSLDGKKWQEVSRAKVPLGASPVAAVVLASQERTTARVDRVFFVPPVPESDGGVGGIPGMLPAPWQALRLPAEKVAEGAPLATPVWKDGGFILEDEGGDFRTSSRDQGILVWRPLGKSQEMIVLLPEAPDFGSSPQLGLAWRADLSPDSPEAALFGANQYIEFLHRAAPDRGAQAWRRVVALRPKEPAYLRNLASYLQRNSGKAEAAEVALRIIELDPDQAFGDASELVGLFGPAQLPTLVERLLAWTPSKRYSPRSNPFSPVIAAAREAKRPDLVVPLVRRSQFLAKEHPNDNLTDDESRKQLLEALVQTGKLDEARAALLACYLPPESTDVPASGQPTLGFGAVDGGPAPQSAREVFYSVEWRSDCPVLSGLGPVDIAAPVGLLPSLQSALLARQAAEPKKFTDEGADWLLSFVRIENRDATVLEELPARLAQITENRRTAYLNLGTENWGAIALDLGTRMLRWPGHDALAREAYRAAGRAAVSTRNSGGTDGLIRSAQAFGELLTGDIPATLGTLRAYADRINTAPTGQYSAEDCRRCLALLARCGPAGDAAFVENYAKWSVRKDTGEPVTQDFREGNSLRTGNYPRFSATAWLLDPGANPGSPEATVVYDIRPEFPDGETTNDLGWLATQGRSFDASGGERTLTILHGPDVEHLRAIGQVKATGTFGTWTGPVPPGGGALKVTIDVPRPQDAQALAAPDAEEKFPAPTPPPAPDARTEEAPEALGAAVEKSFDESYPSGFRLTPVIRAPNLLVNPGFEGVVESGGGAKFSIAGWKDLPGGIWRQSTGEGPLPGRPFVQYVPTKKNGEEQVIRGEKIPLEPGCAYFLSAWMRSTLDGQQTRFGVRFLDTGGREVGLREASSQSLRWVYAMQRLKPGAAASDWEAGIPARAAFVEPFLKFNEGMSWTGLFFGKVD